MDVEPPTGDDLNRMLVSMKQDVLRRAAAEPPARRRPWARRHLGLTLGLVALLGIGGAGGALALVLPSPFQAAPAATPSPTPGPTREPVPGATATVSPAPVEPAVQGPPPTSALALDCADLGPRIGVETIGLNSTPDDLALWGFTVDTAAARQAGILSCSWQGTGLGIGGTAQLVVRIAPAGDRGVEWISGLSESGLRSYGIGDASAYTCDSPEGFGCNSSFVVGPWWVETSSFDSTLPDGSGTDPERIRSLVQALEATLRTERPAPAWEMPGTTWAVSTCEDVASADVASAVGSPEMGSGADATYRGQTGIPSTQFTSFACRWTANADSSALPSDTPVQDVYAEVAPGGGWAFGTETEEGEQVAVTGADDASWTCPPEGPDFNGCLLDVLVDDTWMQVRLVRTNSLGNEGDRPQLIAAAEAIIAAQAASADQG
jgi:hypothetical protein